MILISQYARSKLDAGPKAKIDIERILSGKYNAKVYTFKLHGNEDKDKVSRLKGRIEKIFFSLKYLHGREITVIQFPFNNRRIFTDRVENKIAFIHDLDGIRKKNKKIEIKEIRALKSYNCIIAHNAIMKRYLVNKGIDEKKIFDLQLFDYLCEEEEKKEKILDFNKENVKIAFVGNLEKSPFIYQLKDNKINFQLNLYGNGLKKEKNINTKIRYCGKFKPDELPLKLNADLGLVWDGNFDETDENEGFKNYTKYNNPHKLSCYIAAELPIIVWKKAAVADFVKKSNIGYTISNIYDINNLDFSDYEEKRKNVEKLSKKVRKGEYTISVVEKALKMVSGYKN